MQDNSSFIQEKLLKECRSKILIGLEFDTAWLATEMNAEGLVDEEDLQQITDPNTHLTKKGKAELIVKSLSRKVALSHQHLETMINLLNKKDKMYSDVIKMLEDILSKSEDRERKLLEQDSGNPPPTKRQKLDCEGTSSISQISSSTTSEILLKSKSSLNNENTPISGSTEQASGSSPNKKDCEKISSTNQTNDSSEFRVILEEGQEIRKYQEELAAPGLCGENYIIVAPTGTGKTLVAAQIIANHLSKNVNAAHAVFIVPTKALADQQKDALESYIPSASVEICTGENQRAISQTCVLNNITVCTGGKLYSELCRGEIKFAQLSLMIFDECHSAVRGSVYANVMKLYVEQAMASNTSQTDLKSRLQIVGMTASPGAGKNPRVDFNISLNHLKMLAAHMNATGGIKTVVEHREELEFFRNSPKLNRLALIPRDSSSDLFVQEIVKSMEEIEKNLKPFNCVGIKKWSHEYEMRVRQSINALELSDNEGFLDRIRAFNELLDYCSTLCVYMNLRGEDAIKVLSEGTEIVDIDITHKESREKYAKIRSSLIERLSKLKPMQNPLLKKLEDILHRKFDEDKKSRGLVFVRTRYEAKAMSDWIADCNRLAMAGIRPGMIVGHTGRKKDSMTQAEQKEMIENFRNGEINLLVATSVAEEGLDIPACNLVMRYQYVTSDVKKKQAEGRARAIDSECYAIISSHSPQKYRDVMNEELNLLVHNIINHSYLPSGKALVDDIKKLQKRIIEEKRKKEAIQKQRKVFTGDQIQLLCKECKVLACLGSDVKITGEDEPYYHYTVPKPEFTEKYTIKRHHTPAPLTETIYKTHKIYCKNCGADWGIQCVWSSSGYQYPVIKCINFTFKIEENFIKVKKWSNAPFVIQPMEENLGSEDFS